MQPTIASTAPGRRRTTAPSSPARAITRSSAFSRTAQVLTTITSASSARAAGAGRPPADRAVVGDVHLAAVGLDIDPRRVGRRRHGRAARVARLGPLAERDQAFRHGPAVYHGPGTPGAPGAEPRGPPRYPGR